MKIEGRCRNCKREFPIDLVLAPPESAGHCPFCGKSLDDDYSALLVDALAQLQAIGTQMEAILDRARAVGENLELKPDSVVGSIQAGLGAREAASAERRATRTAAMAEESGVR